MGFTLYELNQKELELLEIMRSGEIEAEQKEAYEQTLEAIGESIEDKLMSYVHVIQQLKAEVKIEREEARRLSQRARTKENNIKRMEEYMKDTMARRGVTRVSDAINTLTLAKNPPKVAVTNVKKLPTEYLIEQAPKVDKRALLDALKQGEIIEGAELEQSEGVRIR